MDAKGARELALNKLVEYCLKQIHEKAERHFGTNVTVALNTELEKSLIKSAVKSLEERGYKVEERGCYLDIRW